MKRRTLVMFFVFWCQQGNYHYVRLKDTVKMASAFWMRTDKQHVYVMKDMSQIDWSFFATMSMSVKMDQQGTIFNYNL